MPFDDDDDAKKQGIARLMEAMLSDDDLSVEHVATMEIGPGGVRLHNGPGKRSDGVGNGERGLKILPEAAVERLQEFAERYNQPCPYKVGDILTVRTDAPLDGKGVPHIVVEVRTLPEMDAMFAAKYLGTPFFGARYNIRVATITEERSNIVSYWMDYADLIPWEAPKDAPKQETEEAPETELEKAEA